MPEHLTIQNPTFPYLAGEPGREASAYIKVSLPHFSALADEPTLDGDTTLFYLPGASIASQNGTDRLSTHVIVLRHSFARDEEGDGTYVVRMEVKGLQMISSWENQIRYAGMLTEILFYPDEAENPFVGAERKDDEADYTANYGYPYLPPRVNFTDSKGKHLLRFPLEVEIDLHYGFVGEQPLSARLAEVMQGHADARAKRQQDREAAAAAKRAERAKREAEHQAWLQTEEGKDETALQMVLDRLRQIPAGNALSDETLANLWVDGEQYATSLTDEQVERFNRARADSFIARQGLAKPENEGRVAFAEGFESGLAVRAK